MVNRRPFKDVMLTARHRIGPHKVASVLETGSKSGRHGQVRPGEPWCVGFRHTYL